ncbi:MAG: hypothetical protein ACLFQV_08915 [Vulcanimicrobiota bacterium]
MRNNRFILLITIVFVLLSLHYAWGLEIINAEKESGNVTMEETRIIDDNCAISGNKIVVKGSVKDSLFVAGNIVKINGDVGGNLVVAGNEIEVTGSVGKDTILAGNVIKVNKSAVLGRDLLTAGRITTMDGILQGNMVNAGKTLVVNGTVMGNVKNTGEKITLGNNARISGDLKYSTAREISFDTTDKIAGNVVFKEETDSSGKKGRNWFLTIIKIVAVLIFGVVLAWLLPNWLEKVSENIDESPLKRTLLGFLIAVLTPLVLLIIAITIVGIPLSLILTLMYILLMFVSRFVGAYYLGRAIRKKADKTWSSVLTMVLGVLILEIFCLIPVVSLIVLLIVVYLGIGGIVSLYYGNKNAANNE